MDTKDYINIFEQSSELLVVIDTNFAIVAVSDAFLKVTTTVRENIVGRNAFDVFPDNPDDKTANGESIVRASFNRVIKNKTKDELPVVKYDIPKPESEGGGYELKYWQATNSPILDDNNNVKYIIHRTEDVTENKTLITQHEFDKKALKLIADSEKRYNMMLMKSPFAFAVLKGKDMVITLANDSVKEMWGKGKDLEGKPLLEVLPEIKDTAFPGLLDNVYITGIPFYGEELLAPILRNGKLEDVYFNFVYQPYLEADETISGVTIIAIEVTNEVIAKKKIKANDERLQNILLQAPAAIAVFDGPQHMFVMANQAYQKQNNRKEKDFLGKSFREVFPELKSTGSFELFDSVYATGETFTASEHVAMIDSDNNGIPKQHYFNFSLEALKNESKEIYGVMVMAFDITELVEAKKILAESEQRFSNLIYTSPTAIGILLGEDLVITIANEPIIEIWGKGKEIMGKKYFEALPELVEQGYKEVFNQVYKTGIPFNAIETPINILQNGVTTLKYYNFILYPQKDINGEINGIGIIATEVTSQAKYNLQIKASEERFRLLAMQAPVAICVVRGKKYVVEIVNAGMLEIWGRTEAQVLNKPIFEVLTELDNQDFEARVDEVYSTGERFVTTELPLAIHRNGRLEDLFVKFVYEPLCEADGTVSGVMVLADEITDQVNARKKIEKNEHRFEGAISAVQGILWTNSAIGEMIGEQLAWASLTGQSYDEYQGFGWANAIHPDDAQPTIDAWNEAVSESKNFIFEHRVRMKDGNWGNFSIRAIPSLNSEGLIQEWIGVHTDITEQRQIENALKNAIHEQKEAKSKAEAAAQIAEDAVKAKQQFLSNMSHEIRTPMNSIIGFTNVVLKTDLDKKQKEYINAIKVSGDALLVLINDILDLAKVDAGKMTFEQIPFNLIASISSMIQVFDNKIKEKNLKLVSEYGFSIPEVLEGDPMRLRQIILNLISNAVKFTAKGEITLSIFMLKEDSENVTLEFAVKDTGIGISENKLEHVFDDFKQIANENSRLYGGTGLGLAIVKQLVEYQGGTVSVQSKIDIGSTFSFILSFKKITPLTPATLSTSTQAPAPAPKNVKVLIVEDVALNQLLMKTFLVEFGFQFDIADNGKIAIEKLQQSNYDIILMDLQMPEMNGFEATEYIRNTMNSKIPIIALTADVTTVDVEKCKAFGMNDYISKPIDEQLLYSKIIKYLKKPIE